MCCGLHPGSKLIRLIPSLRTTGVEGVPAGNPVGFDSRQGYNAAYWKISELHTMFCRSRYLLWLVILVLGTGSMLSACGQKGPLYLPDPATEQQEATKDN